MGLVLVAAVTMFDFTLRDPDWVPCSPIMLLQGAPVAHYESEHAIALGLFRALASHGDTHGVWLLTLVLAVAWRHLHEMQSTSTRRLVISVLACEGFLVLASFLFNAALAFHHVGWGMPCNSQWAGTFLGLNLCVFPVFLPVAAWMARSRPDDARHTFQ